MTYLGGREYGYSMTEMMVTLLILSLALGVGLPSFVEMINNTRIRTTADSIMSGLQLAKSEAVRTNARVRFSLDGTTGSWVVRREELNDLGEISSCIFGAGAIVQQRQTDSKTRNILVSAFGDTTASTATASTIVVFGPNGWRGCNNLAQFEAINIESTEASEEELRKLRVVVTRGGAIRMCDPAVLGTDTRACPQ